MKKKAASSVLMLTLILLVSIFIASDVLAQLKPQRYPSSPQPTIQPQPIPSQTPTISAPPKVLSFKINNNAATTSSLTVYLNNRTERASQYRASQRQDFKGAQWRSLIPAPQFTLDSGDGKKRVYFQVRNSIGQVSIVVSDTIYLSMIPTVTSFKVISWLPSEYYGGSFKLYVKTENIATNNPTHFRLSEKSDFSNTDWRPYLPKVIRYVEKGTGNRTVYFQVKNNYGRSTVKTATFVVPSRKDFIIHAGRAKRYSQPLGFNFSITPKDITSRCEMDASHNYIELRSPKGLTGSRCDYTLFSGKSIKTGWVFKRFMASAMCSSPNRGYSIIPPNEGSRQIRFKVHLWTNSNNACTWYLNKIILEGPGDAHWKEAFN